MRGRSMVLSSNAMYCVCSVFVHMLLNFYISCKRSDPISLLPACPKDTFPFWLSCQKQAGQIAHKPGLNDGFPPKVSTAFEKRIRKPCPCETWRRNISGGKSLDPWGKHQPWWNPQRPIRPSNCLDRPMHGTGPSKTSLGNSTRAPFSMSCQDAAFDGTGEPSTVRSL